MDAMIDTTIRQQLSYLDPTMDPTSAILAGMNRGGFGQGDGGEAALLDEAVMPEDSFVTSTSSKEAGYERVHVVKVDTWGLDMGHRRKEMGLVPTISPLPKRHRPAPFMQALVKSADDRAGGKKGTGPFSEHAKSPTKKKKKKTKIRGVVGDEAIRDVAVAVPVVDRTSKLLGD